MKNNNNLTTGQFRGKVLAKLENIEQDVVEIKQDAKEGRKRIQSLENRLNYGAGIIVGAGAIAGGAVSYITDLFRK